jgi:hypothetical protein
MSVEIFSDLHPLERRSGLTASGLFGFEFAIEASIRTYIDSALPIIRAEAPADLRKNSILFLGAEVRHDDSYALIF